MRRSSTGGYENLDGVLGTLTVSGVPINTVQVGGTGLDRHRLPLLTRAARLAPASTPRG